MVLITLFPMFFNTKARIIITALLSNVCPIHIHKDAPVKYPYRECKASVTKPILFPLFFIPHWKASVIVKSVIRLIVKINGEIFSMLLSEKKKNSPPSTYLTEHKTNC